MHFSTPAFYPQKRKPREAFRGTTTANRTQSGHELIATSGCQVACYGFPCVPRTCNTFCSKQQHDVHTRYTWPFCQGKNLVCSAVGWLSALENVSKTLCANAMGACNINEQHILALPPNQSYDVFAGEATLRILDLVTRTAKCQFICHTPKH